MLQCHDLPTLAGRGHALYSGVHVPPPFPLQQRLPHRPPVRTSQLTFRAVEVTVTFRQWKELGFRSTLVHSSVEPDTFSLCIHVLVRVQNMACCNYACKYLCVCVFDFRTSIILVIIWVFFSNAFVSFLQQIIMENLLLPSRVQRASLEPSFFRALVLYSWWFNEHICHPNNINSSYPQPRSFIIFTPNHVL